jgi:protein O-GlcNAc transferase
MNQFPPTLPLGQALSLAIERHRAGEVSTAADVYREVLAHDPDNPQVLYLLAVCEHQRARYGDAEVFFRRAISQDSSQPQFHLGLGRNYKQQEKFPEAVQSYRRALQLSPNSVDAMVSLGIALWRDDDADEAAAILGRAAQLEPQSFEAAANLGNALLGADRYEDAIEAYRNALRLRPLSVETLNNLGRALVLVGQTVEARQYFDKALSLAPGYAEALFNIGELHFLGGDLAEGARYYAKAVVAQPNHVEAYLALGRALFDAGRLDQALETFVVMAAVAPASPLPHIWRAMVLRELSRGDEAVGALEQAVGLARDPAEVHLELGETYYQLGDYAKALECMNLTLSARPGMARAFNLEGNLALFAGQAEKAVAAYDRAIALEPEFPVYSHNALFARNYSDHSDSESLARAHREWGASRPTVDTPFPGQSRTRMPEGRLRVGFVSPDFRGHSVAHFITPILANLNKAGFESICYANNRRSDAVTEMQRRYADGWRAIAGKSDRVVADLIARDGVDILIDLAGHTAENRLGVFAQAAAPVQITYLGYPTTTGLPAMHYRMTDCIVDPKGSESMNTETLLRLPDSYFCYMMASEAPASVGPLPARAKGTVTFGSFNNLAKISLSTLRLWARVFEAIPGARLMLKNKSLGDRAVREAVSARLAEAGIAQSRVDLHAFDSVRASHLALYNEVDIALDTFPYNGATTTCEALWMGVPVVTLRGATHASRMGASILTAARLRDCIADDESAFVEICRKLASDLRALAGLRAGLRTLMISSALMDHATFVRHFEAALLRAWESRVGP